MKRSWGRYQTVRQTDRYFKCRNGDWLRICTKLALSVPI